uniref:Transmembrane protein n=1 Tax=Anisakis simplex TaxID=6269 RepID=A0A0M3K125_ANISI
LDQQNLAHIKEICAVMATELGEPDVAIGITYISIGLLYVILYVPCMFGILHPSNFKHPCYKIMAVMGVIDILTLTIGIISGYFSLVGGSVCNSTTFMIICGNCVMGFWSTYCGVSIYLGINRCGDVYGSPLMDVLFKGYRTWLFMLIPLSLGLSVMLFGPTMYYNGNRGTWFFDADINDSHVRVFCEQKLRYPFYNVAAPVTIGGDTL